VDAIRTVGLRLVAGVFVLSGCLALGSFVSTGQLKYRLRQGGGLTHLDGIGALGFALLLMGCGTVALLVTIPAGSGRHRLQVVAMALLIIGGVLMAIEYAIQIAA
jgi:hypothetical protein